MEYPILVDYSVASLYAVEMEISNAVFPEKTRDRIILAGAGFSASVGGYLATEMWEQLLLSETVAKSQALRNAVKNPAHEFDYEKIFHHVLASPDFDDTSKTAIRNAMDGIYGQHNRHVQDSSVSEKINYKWLRAFLKSFCSTGNDTGLLFTTNQDLFFENLTRHLHVHHALESYIPSNTRPPDRQSSDCFLSALGLPGHDYSNNKSALPESDDLPRNLQECWNQKGFLQMVKLHGSWGWKSLSDQQQVIVGMNKRNLIERVPLLKYYLKLFEKTLAQFKGKLLIIGYGFSDDHINEAIMNGLGHGMELHVIDKLRPMDFYNLLLKKKCPQIWEGLVGYYPYGLQELFPPTHSVMTGKDKITTTLMRQFHFDFNDF